MAESSLVWQDWLVIAAYGSGMLAVGWYYARKTRSTEDYLLGGRKMNPITVGLSLFATLMSTLSFLAYPGEMIKHGPMVFAGLTVLPVVYLVVGYVLIPRFMRLNVTSAYEILETRFGLSVRLMGTLFFLSLRFLWMATIIYATVNKALIGILNVDPKWAPLICLSMGLITLAYTSLGGLRAVVITDAIQTLILLLGAVVTLLLITHHFGGPGGWFPQTWFENWEEFRIGPELQGRLPIVNAMIMIFTWYICTAGSDQMAIQRYLATRNVKAARRTMAVSLSTNFIVQVILALVGLALMAYFTQMPQLLEDGSSVSAQADRLFPRFIVVGLPPGLSGLVTAGLMAAAMSSLSSGVNSSASVISRDLFERFSRKKRSEQDNLKRVQLISVVTGLAATALSLGVGWVEGNLLEVVIKVVNLFVGPLFVLFFLALFVPFANTIGALVGGVAGVAIAVAIGYFEIFNIGIAWMVFLALVGGVIVGMITSIIVNYFLRLFGIIHG
ncbi:MAG: sodium/solute symporter [Sedimentisphaerales bacterium]|nr:sodium/solute symporter [Sedimentisphaerales bacterium]